MHKSNYKQIALAVCFAFLPFSAQSAGLGKLTVISGLGEPLRAEIDLVSTTPEELSSLSAAIAPQEAYAVQGIERTSIHSAIQIEIIKKPDGGAMLKLATRQPVDDPFLDMLIQVDWATGRLLREYTVLLDPPGYKESQTSSIVTTPAELAPIPAPVAVQAPAEEKVSALPPATIAKDEYTTKSGDTLNRIAKDMQIEGYSLDQMLVAIYRSNRQAFSGENMNRLKVGQIIKAPTSEELSALNQKEAAKEVRVQTSDWNAYRNKLAGIVAEAEPTAEEAGDQAASGKLRTATEDKAASEAAGPRDVVKLSKSEVQSASNEALQDKLSTMQEENVARQKSIDEANERVAMLEKQITDLQELLTIKDKTLAGLQGHAAAVPDSIVEAAPAAIDDDARPEVAPEETTASVGAETPEAKTPKPAAKKQPTAAPAPTEEPSLLDGLADNGPVLGMAAGALVLLAGGWLFIRNRRKRNLDSFEQGILTAGGLKANTVFGNTSGGTVDTGDTSFLTNFSQNPSGMIDTHDVDPIAEAEVYMAYGRDSQAEEILNDAISKEPTRYELHLKLLEIFAARNDTSAFEAVAGELYSTLGSGDPVWVKVAEMGHKLESANPLYDLSKVNAADAAVTVTASAASESPDKSRLDASDFDNVELMSEASLDFSLGEEVATSDENGAVKAESTDSSLDFDLGFAVSPPEIEPSPEAVVSDAAPSDESLSSSGGIDFNMDFGTKAEDPMISDQDEAFAEKTVQFEAPGFGETVPNLESPDFNVEPEAIAKGSDTSNNLDLGEFSSDFNLAATSEPEPELATETPKEDVSGLDFNFDLGGEAAAAEAQFDDSAETASTGDNALEMDLSGISLDIAGSDADIAMNEPAANESESEEVNTKLDLVTAYMDMGDNEGARELLDEVLKEGGPRQRQRGQELLNSLS